MPPDSAGLPVFLILTFQVGGLADNVERNELKNLLLQFEELGQLRVADHYVDSAASLGEILDRYPPASIRFIHAIGHGEYRRLQMLNPNGNVEPLQSSQFARLLTLRGIKPRLIFFSACHSQSMFAPLKRSGISAIGYEGDVEDHYAIKISRQFYYHGIPILKRAARPLFASLEFAITECAGHLNDGFRKPSLSAGRDHRSMHLFDFLSSSVSTGKIDEGRPMDSDADQVNPLATGAEEMRPLNRSNPGRPDPGTHGSPSKEKLRVFISYSWDDESHKQNVRALAESLRSNGLNVIIDQFVPPNEIANFPGWMTEQVAQADYVLIVCTKRYHEIATNPSNAKSSGVLFESILWLNEIYYEAQKVHKYVPILLESADRDQIPTVLKGRPSYRLSKFLLTDASYEAMIRHLTNQPAVIPPPVGEIPDLPPMPPVFEKSAKPKGEKPHNLPYPSLATLFVGREKVLEELRHAFVEANKTSAQSPFFQVVHALGGIGKTRLAVEYAWKYAEHYDALLFVGGNDLARLIGDLAGLAGTNCLDLRLPDDMIPRDKANRVLHHLRSHPGWLLIIDNVDDETAAGNVEKLLQALTGGHVLITSRWRGWNDQFYKVRPLDLLELSSASDLILKLTQRNRRETPDDIKEAEGLATDLGRLSLAIQQAAAYINASPSLSIAEYRERWQKKFRELAGFKNSYLYNKDEGGELLTILTTWQTTFDRLSKSARWWMDHLAFLAPEPIPTILVDELHKLDPTENKPDWNTPESAVAELQRYLLLDRSENAFPNIGQMHRLVQSVVREKMEENRKSQVCTVIVAALRKRFTGDPSEVVNRSRLESLEGHVALILRSVANENTDPRSDLGILEEKYGMLLNAMHHYELAEPILRRIAEAYEKIYGLRDPRVAIRFNNYAKLLFELDRYPESERCYKIAIEVEMGRRRPERSRLADFLNNYAELLRKMRRYKDALPLYKRSISIHESDSLDNPKLTMVLNNIAILFMIIGRLEDAVSEMTRSIDIAEKSYGVNSPELAIAFVNMSLIMQELGDWSIAEYYINKAIDIEKLDSGRRLVDLSLSELRACY